MTFKWVQVLVLVAVFYPVFTIGFCLYLTVRLPLCGNKLNRIFCSNWPVVQLSCVDTTLNNIAGRRSSEFRGKALQTCLPHIVSFMTYSISLFLEVSLTRLEAGQLNPSIAVILSLAYLIIPPLNNPIVYGLGLPQIKGVVLRFLKKGPAAEI
ncbi:hypothetical protein JOQ06_030488 [Pogonophryne albipinna]|uniref:Uncharacterized protein n=1 Tax=Pogonophryne albipinna TaxID=1090488 RepID=A0AAD6AX57_9TELE|nr:hypothetical protein JOQ06_030488 [Pogonophryne albipinna]